MSEAQRQRNESLSDDTNIWSEGYAGETKLGGEYSECAEISMVVLEEQPLERERE